MEEQPSIPQVNESRPRPGYPRHWFAFLMVVLALVVVGIAIAQVAGTRHLDLPAISETVLQGDISLRIAYALENWTSRIPAESPVRSNLVRQAEAFRRETIILYERASKGPSPADAIRRLIVIRTPSQRPAEIEKLAGLVRAGSPQVGVGGLSVEVAMWRDIYLRKGKLDPDIVGAYRSRIGDLGLGVLERFALADLYKRAGMTAREKSERSAAVRIAAVTGARLLGMQSALVLLGLVGTVILIGYAWRSGMGRGAHGPEFRLPADFREAKSSFLLGIFLVYILVWLGTQLVAGLVLAVGILMGGDGDPTAEVYAMTGSYVLGGALALAYLLYRLRAAGWPPEMVGLASRKPLQDIGWGIAGYAATLPLLWLTALLTRYLQDLVPGPPNPVIPLISEAGGIERLMLVILVGLAAPFFEEVFFRGVLFSSLRARWGVVAGVFVSSLMFAAVHPSPASSLQLFILGTVFSVLFYERKSLIPSMVAHSLVNTVTVVTVILASGK